MSDPSSHRIQRTEGVLGPLVLVAVVVLLRARLAGELGLAPDEAYYWSWGQRLAWGYFDHPPVIAWIIRLSGALFGEGEGGLRALLVLSGGATAVVVVLLSRRPWLAAMAVCTLPLLALGGILATPDVPLMLGWALALVGAARGGRWWLLAGLGVGLAVLSKYTGLILFPLLLLGRPDQVRTRWPWLAAAVAGLMVLPHLVWLAHHDWVTLRFQFGHGLGVSAGSGLPPVSQPVAGLSGMAAYLGGQMGLVTPLILLAMLAFWSVAWREGGLLRLWWWTSLPVFLLFGLTSWLVQAEPNWPAPAYLGAILGLAHLSYRWRRVTWVGVGFAAVVSVAVMVHTVHPLWDLPAGRDPTLRLQGGEVLGQAVEAWGVPHVYTSRYQEAAWIRYYGGLQAQVLPGLGRPCQYDLWRQSEEPEYPAHAIFVRPWRRSPPHRLDEAWQRREGPNTVVARDELLRKAGRWQVYEVWGYKGPVGAEQ